MKKKVQAVPVHLGGGTLSAFCAALFAEEAYVSRVFANRGGRVPLPWGLFLGGGGLPLAGMVIGVLVVCSFTMLLTALFFGTLYLIDQQLGFRWFVMRSSVYSEDVMFAAEDERLPLSYGIAGVTQHGLLVLSPRTPNLDETMMPASSNGKDTKRGKDTKHDGNKSKAEKKMQRKDQQKEKEKLKEARKQRQKLGKKQRKDEDIEMRSIEKDFEETRIAME